uniref:Rab11 family-interacting protein 5 n=1 Tax=Oryzias latipes TaxID=8090 RepID=A0A3P9JE10_ORYLA
MMSLIDLDDDQRWVPTHVNVTVLRARGLRTKGKHGSRYLYTIIQLGKEKYTTGLVEKAEVPVWNEECCFELLPGVLEDGGRSAYPPGSGNLVVTVMHRVLIGLDVFLGQTIIPLDRTFQDGVCPREEWFKLNSKAGRKEKERGELQLTVQFTRNNMTASMFDLTIKDKPRSAFGKLKDRVTGKKRGDMESSSAIVPGRYAALSGSLGPPFGEEGGGPTESQDSDITEEKRNKMKDFFKGRLRKSSDTRSCSSLASESSMSSMTSDNLGPPPSLDLLSDPPSSPIYTSKVRVNPQYGDADLAKKVLTSQHTTKVLTHKRAFSDEVGMITTASLPPNAAVETLKGQTMTQSKSSLCINGSHVYDSEPSTPKSSGPLPTKLVLLEKYSPLSRSLQNLTKRGEDKGSFAEGRRWSFDKFKKEEKEEEKTAQPSSTPQEASAGRSDSVPAKTDTNQTGSAAEGRLRGWFGAGDSQNKPRLEVSPNVDAPLPAHPCSPAPPQCSSPPASSSHHASPDKCGDINLFTPSPSPCSPPLSPSNPFFQHMQRNPFFEALIAEELQTSPTFGSRTYSGFARFLDAAGPAQCGAAGGASEVSSSKVASIKRERPRSVSRQGSLPALHKAVLPESPNHSASRSTLDSAVEWEESFDAFASSRLNIPSDSVPSKQQKNIPPSCKTSSVNNNIDAQELRAVNEEPPPLPPRRLLRTPVNEIFSDGWLHRGQELAVHKEAYLLSQTGAASLQHGKDAECKQSKTSPDAHTSSEVSDSLSAPPHTNASSPGFTPEEQFRKFKYKPLEDDSHCWAGTLYEQDLFGHVFRGKYSQAIIEQDLFSMNAEGIAGNKIKPNPLDCEVPICELTSKSCITTSKAPDSSTTNEQGIVDLDLRKATCLNTNMYYSLTMGDLNMNVNNSDFDFIDSDRSSQSGVAEIEKKKISGETVTLTDSQVSVYKNRTEDIYTLKETYIPTTNSSFEITASSNELQSPTICQDNHQHHETNTAPCGHCRVNGGGVDSLKSTTPFDVKMDCKEHEKLNEFNRTYKDCDDNRNPQHESAKPNQSQSFSGVASARIRPKGTSRQNSNDSPRSQSKNGDRELEQFLSLVQNTSEIGEDHHRSEKPSEISFEDLHAHVAPNCRTPVKSKIETSLTQHDHCSSNTPSALCLLADTSICSPKPPSSAGSISGGPHTSFNSPATDQPPIHARHSPPPEETQPARNLPLQQSRPHPVKPLTSTQSEKKESRSVLDKLRSTIAPGRSAQQTSAEPENSQAEMLERVTHYQHLTNMELISLLLQQEMDMQKQQVASDQQGAQLEKCEAELKKVKAQVRDLEDYIDNLLLRIIEQTPTLLQVRARHK